MYKEMMKFSDFVNLDMGELSDWLIENHDKYYLMESPKPVTNASGIDSTLAGKSILCWDGCEWHVDKLEKNSDGSHQLKEGTHVEYYMSIPEIFIVDNKHKLEDLLDLSMNEVSDWVIENQYDFVLMPKYEEVDSAEDIGIVGENILCLVEPEWVIDYVEVESDLGTLFMANETKIEAFIPLPDQPRG